MNDRARELAGPTSAAARRGVVEVASLLDSGAMSRGLGLALLVVVLVLLVLMGPSPGG